jgi:hypothetical protein
MVEVLLWALLPTGRMTPPVAASHARFVCLRDVLYWFSLV